jgi:Ca2+-binding RTX toxin-like protein
MAKPSVTNIRPPSQTTVWTPPKTNWDLNSATDWQAAYDAGWAAADTDAGYGSLTSKVNLSEPSPADLDLGDLSGANYDYIFFGVNGGMDETVIGKTNAAGVIVTGNGMDKITGGNLGDLIFAGNGKDVVNAGAGNDIVFGENGADQLNAGSDNGTARYQEATEGEIVVTQGGDPVFVWDHDPNNETGVPDPSDHTIRKEGVYVEDPDGTPIFHTVFSFSPETSGTYTIAYYNANQLDGPGDPSPDYFTVNLVAGTKYFYSFLNDNDTVHVRIFDGALNPPPSGPPGQWPVDAIASSQALPTNYELTSSGGDPGIFEFDAGDELIGGNGPDTFIYDAAQGPNNVDLIWDFNQGDGTYNALEGDTLVLKNTGITDVADLVTTSDHDVDGDGNNDLVIFISDNHAIGLVGITDLNQVYIVFG